MTRRFYRADSQANDSSSFGGGGGGGGGGVSTEWLHGREELSDGPNVALFHCGNDVCLFVRQSITSIFGN
jgi:hypothetical protein